MRRASALMLFVVFAAPTLAQERTHDITPDDYATVNLITEVAVSPDGKRVAYCLATWDKKADNRKTELWVVDTDGKGKPQQLTKDRGNDHSPKWSADGKAIYVLANRKKEKEKKPPLDGKTQVWKVSLEGSEPVAMTKVGGGVTGYDYAPNSDTLFYSMDATTTDQDDFSRLRKKFDKPEYGSGKRTVSELFAVTEGGKETKKLIAAKRYIREFAVTRNGQRIAMVTAFDDTVLKSEGESRVDVWEDGKITTPPTDVYRAKAATPWAWLESLAWNPDGTRFAFCAIFDGYPAEVIIGELKKAKWTTGQMERKPGTQVRGYGSPLQWMSGAAQPEAKNKPDVLVVMSDADGGTGLLFYNPEVRESYGLSRPGLVFYAFDILPGGQTPPVVLRSNTGGFPVLEFGLDKKSIILLDPNPHTKTWKFPTIQHITWKAPDGTEVGGPLELPYGWKQGDKPLPLVVAIHGGPTTASYNDLRFDPHNGRLYFAAKGYAVLCPNYRGSTGYGDKFVTDLIGHENDIEVKDILAGIQHLVKEGIADPDRIAVMGWSNGGYLTNCLITLKDPPVKIRAASSGGCIVDTVAEWGFNDEPAYPRVFKKGLPWEVPDNYRKTSPTYGLGNVKTPTVIHVGGADPRCPSGHSRMLHRALKEYVKVPTELVVYPGEPHGLTKLSNRVAKMEWDLAWFEKYLKR
jgi:dipeptidyl aminopeptidase/acylaminoacyl peptidase